MLCPFCRNDTKVTDKRTSETETRRRRECLKCGKRFTTYERLEPFEIRVIKKDGSRENFSRDKLKAGILKSLEKRPVSMEKIDHMIIEIEENLAKSGKEVTSQKIGELVMKKLKKLDKVAYIRFASVYRNFQDIKDFKDQIKEVS